MPEKPTTYPQVFRDNCQELWKLKRTHPGLFAVLLLVVCLAFSLWVWEKFWGKAKLETTINEQKQQITTLEIQLLPFKTIALEKYPGKMSEALSGLASDVRRFDEELEDAEKRIRGLDLTLTYEMSANWKGGKAPDPSGLLALGSGAVIELVFVMKDGTVAEAKFQKLTEIKLTPIQGGAVLASYYSTCAPGSKVFGVTPDVIEAIRDFRFTCVAANKNSLEDGNIMIGKIKAEFYVNGQPRFECAADKVRQVQDGALQREGDLRLRIPGELKVSPSHSQK